ncbi:hypothetical protein LINPERPRIM_LOCUS37153 [Linum perenne]
MLGLVSSHLFAIRLSTLISVSLSRPPPSIPFTSLPPSISFTSIPPSISYFASTPITGCTCSSFTVNSSSMEILLLLDFRSKEAEASSAYVPKSNSSLFTACSYDAGPLITGRHYKSWRRQLKYIGMPRIESLLGILNIGGTSAVQMIPHFYYNAKRPAFVNKDARRTV